MKWGWQLRDVNGFLQAIQNVIRGVLEQGKRTHWIIKNNGLSIHTPDFERLAWVALYKECEKISTDHFGTTIHFRS